MCAMKPKKRKLEQTPIPPLPPVIPLKVFIKCYTELFLNGNNITQRKDCVLMGDGGGDGGRGGGRCAILWLCESILRQADV